MVLLIPSIEMKCPKGQNPFLLIIGWVSR